MYEEGSWGQFCFLDLWTINAFRIDCSFYVCFMRPLAKKWDGFIAPNWILMQRDENSNDKIEGDGTGCARYSFMVTLVVCQ